MPDQSTTASSSGGNPDSGGTDRRNGTDPDSDASGGHDHREPHDASDSADGDTPGSVDPDESADVGFDRSAGGDSEESADGTNDADSGRFRKLDDAEYDRVNDFLRGYVDFTAREWAVARLCADFRTGTGVPMKTVGEHLPEMVPFVTEPYTRQEVYEARRAFEDRVRRAAATFLYGANSGFLAAEEVDDVLYEATEVAKLLLEVEGASVSTDAERATEERTVAAMRSVHEASVEVRYDDCPHCGARLDGAATESGGTTEAGDGTAADEANETGDGTAADDATYTGRQ